jgi:2-C-methyl-D-erythritol 4-phosphate cytidylyltransferase / 2-C-methyl-D-erythritol 2,4-cyclodiphosphate synthase
VDGAVAIVLAAGRGERMDSAIPKALMSFDGATVVARAVERVMAAPSVSGVVVVAPPGFEDAVGQAIEAFGVDAVVAGGETRQASVAAGLAVVAADADRILCHDAARPLASPQLFERALEALEGWDGVVPVLRVVDTVKRVQDGTVEGTEPRDGLALAQTPQAFLAAALRDAHERAAVDGFEGSDDALLLERAGYRVRAIEGERTNLKITTADDVRLAEALAR